MTEFYVDHPQSLSLISAVQFTGEKSEFKWLVTMDRKCFCGTTSNLAQNFTPDK